MKNTNFNDWLDTFVEEKGIEPYESFELYKNGTLNLFTYGAIIDAIKSTSLQEQKVIKKQIVKIDFLNGDVKHYFRHLAKALAREF